MKKRYYTIQLLALALILFSTILVSATKNPDEVRIKLTFKQGPWDSEGVGYNDGRWHANGVITDAGTVHDDYIFDNSDGSMSSSYTMIGKHGELYIDVELGPFEWIGPWTGKFEGTYTITGGTGEYASILGSGEATQIIVYASTMHAGEYMVGAPCISNHVVLEGTIQN